MRANYPQEMQARINLIREGLVKVYGKNLTNAGENAMWMQILVNLAAHMARGGLKYIEDGVARAAATEELETSLADFDKIAQSVHEDVCVLLDVHPHKSLEVFQHFKQVFNDALNAHRRD